VAVANLSNKAVLLLLAEYPFIKAVHSTSNYQHQHLHQHLHQYLHTSTSTSSTAEPPAKKEIKALSKWHTNGQMLRCPQ
jgi:hypothetical protein